MARRRTKDLGLPPRVYRSRSGKFAYHPPSGGSVIIAGRKADLREIWMAYQGQIISLNQCSLRYFADRYYDSNNFKILSTRTQQDYYQCEKKPIAYFREFDCHRMEPRHISEYLNHRLEESKRRANLELTWFKNVFTNACGQGLFRGTNPTTDIMPFRQSREERKATRLRKRYVSDADYKAMYTVVPITGKVAMEIAYCTGLRPGDVLSLRREHIQADLLDIEENKTGHEYSKVISPRLHKALVMARDLPGQPFGGWIVRNRHGNKYTAQGWQANWKTWKQKVPEQQRFNFDMIRHKAITDARTDKLKFSMHQDARMLGIYDHELPISPSH